MVLSLPLELGGVGEPDQVDDQAPGGSLEGTARELFVHPNTVRYRLRRVADVTGLTPTIPRDAWSLRMALALGRLGEDRTST